MRRFSLSIIYRTGRKFLITLYLVVLAFVMFSCALNSNKSPHNKEFTFAQICDSQLGFGGYEHDIESFRQTVKQVNAINPDLVFICGDLVNTIAEKSISDFNKIKQSFNMPCCCAPGSHDIGNDPTLLTMQNYRKVMGKDYFSFVHKGNVFIIVNTQFWKTPVKNETEKQDAWLETTMKSAANNDSRIFIVGHHPLFLQNLEEDNGYCNLSYVKRKQFLTLFEKYGVVAVLGRHMHTLYINEYNGMQLVNAETISKTIIFRSTEPNNPYSFETKIYTI
jgi:predicted MPP superfamily phosphohydrolase